MRVTNQMVTSGSLRNMQKSMQRVNDLNQQVTTGKKISAPSDDPVIAIRALKLRTTCDQLTQFKNKNVQDAKSWVDTTQSSIQNVFDRLQDVYYYCVEGANDPFQSKDRKTVINELQSLKDAIYREGSSTYAGRYLFSGYKTETNLVFQDEQARKGISYDITENISPRAFEERNVVLNEIKADDLDAYLDGSRDYEIPEQQGVYRIRLAYNNLSSGSITIKMTSADDQESYIQATTLKTTEADEYYKLGDNDVHFIPETGELIFGKDVYNSIKNARNIEVNYSKANFAVGDLRPEMYFDCTMHKRQLDGTIKDTSFVMNPGGQKIQYEVNFNQYITVNAEGNEFITHDMGNKIADLARAVQDVQDVEDNIARLKTMREDPQYMNRQEAVERIDRMLEDANTELAMKSESMQKLFGNNMTNFQNFMEDVGTVQARVATTYSKLELIETRVTEQLANFRELKSSNEDVETEEAAIEMYQAELVYEAALSTTASVIKKTLLDYL